MNWQRYWERLAKKSDPNKQVGRVASRPVDTAMLDRIAQYIITQVDLEEDDGLLDVCCGNGILTERLAQSCRKVTGVDLSELQIEHASRSKPANTDYIRGNALELTELLEHSYDKIICYFSFQYFDSKQKGFELIHQMKQVLEPGGIIFIGDIPDSARRHAYFPTLKDRFRHEIRKLFNREQMGKFWRKSTLDNIAESLDLEGKSIEQPEDLLYAHYRFDYLLKERL